MPKRKQPLINGQIYHVFNRGIDGRHVFYQKRDYYRALQTLKYYQYNNHQTCLSHFLVKNLQEQANYFASIQGQSGIVTILAFCFMPSHFHLLLRQNSNGGISIFLKQFQGSYTKYLNTRTDRIGPLFQTQFKSVIIETEYQLQHVARYIHLNPYSSHLVDPISNLTNYQWSSLPAYSDRKTINSSEIAALIDVRPILSAWSNPQKLLQFTLDQADYQKGLEAIKHLQLEN